MWIARSASLFGSKIGLNTQQMLLWNLKHDKTCDKVLQSFRLEAQHSDHLSAHVPAATGVWQCFFCVEQEGLPRWVCASRRKQSHISTVASYIIRSSISFIHGFPPVVQWILEQHADAAVSPWVFGVAFAGPMCCMGGAQIGGSGRRVRRNSFKKRHEVTMS